LWLGGCDAAQGVNGAAQASHDDERPGQGEHGDGGDVDPDLFVGGGWLGRTNSYRP
jgi:hypothetical protein